MSIKRPTSNVQRPTSNAEKIMVAMSGGVDSSVCAALLQKQGYQVHGVFMLLAQEDGEEQAERARNIAQFLGIPLDVVDLSADFKRQVLDYFVSSYANGLTPNPCVVCNHTIKFGKLLEFATAKNIKRLATGHYARVRCGVDGITRLMCGDDPRKDQSYFLCRLTQQQLARVCFPLGETTKDEVYKVAAEFGLSGKHSSESQDICFMQNTSLKDFLAARTSHLPVPGNFVTLNGEIKGRHDGINNYTVGQRRGLGIPDSTPFYVVALNPATNQVIIGKDQDLWQDSLRIKQVNWQTGTPPSMPIDLQVKIRYRHQAAAAKVEERDGIMLVTFEQPQRAITPGQFAVLYDGDTLVGGGEIV